MRRAREANALVRYSLAMITPRAGAFASARIGTAERIRLPPSGSGSTTRISTPSAAVRPASVFADAGE